MTYGLISRNELITYILIGNFQTDLFLEFGLTHKCLVLSTIFHKYFNSKKAHVTFNNGTVFKIQYKFKEQISHHTTLVDIAEETSV